MPRNNHISGALSIKTFKLYNIILLAAGIAICWFLPNSGEIRKKFTEAIDSRNKRAYLFMAAAAAMFAICVMSMNKVASFLYFQF